MCVCVIVCTGKQNAECTNCTIKDSITHNAVSLHTCAIDLNSVTWEERAYYWTAFDPFHQLEMTNVWQPLQTEPRDKKDIFICSFSPVCLRESNVQLSGAL